MMEQAGCSDMAFYEVQYAITKSECNEHGYIRSFVAYAPVGTEDVTMPSSNGS